MSLVSLIKNKIKNAVVAIHLSRQMASALCVYCFKQRDIVSFGEGTAFSIYAYMFTCTGLSRQSGADRVGVVIVVVVVRPIRVDTTHVVGVVGVPRARPPEPDKTTATENRPYPKN